MRWFKRTKPVAAPATRPVSARLEVEQLETRNLLSNATLAVASGIVHSVENYGNFVTTEYNQFLRRSPDLAGFNSWLGQLEAGMAPELVEASFVSSPEYILNHGNDATAWLTGLYNDLLGRNPDSAGLNSWLNTLAAGTTQFQVAFDFAISIERQSIVISQDYVTFLGRQPDSGAVPTWLNYESQGHNRADVATQILASDEFFLDHNSNPSTFIIGLYQTVLLRTPSQPEVDAWLAVYNAHL